MGVPREFRILEGFHPLKTGAFIIESIENIYKCT